MTQIAMVAGEPSGDLLAARILQGIRAQQPNCQFTGIGGPAMLEAGQQQWHDLEALSVFGYVDALKQLPRLWRIFQQTKKRCLNHPPQVYVGIDAPDFNLRMEKALKAADIPTVQFVSPSIWAWRYDRIHNIRSGGSHTSGLFPFEVPIYEQEGVPVTYVGHPLAQEIPLNPCPKSARRALGLAYDATVLAILPGSRASEIKWLAPLFLQVAQQLQARHADLHVVIPAVNAKRAQELQNYLQQYLLRNAQIVLADDKPNTANTDHSQSSTNQAITDGVTTAHKSTDKVSAAQNQMSWQCIQADNALMLASGTATLGGMMFKKPMLIAYILSPWMRRLMAWQSGQQRPSTPWVGLPNILAQKEIAHEFLQDEATVANLVPATERALFDEENRQQVQKISLALHQELRVDTAKIAADTILSYV